MLSLNTAATSSRNVSSRSQEYSHWMDLRLGSLSGCRGLHKGTRPAHMQLLEKEARASKLLKTEQPDRGHKQLLALGGQPQEAGREKDYMASKSSNVKYQGRIPQIIAL